MAEGESPIGHHCQKPTVEIARTETANGPIN